MQNACLKEKYKVNVDNVNFVSLFPAEIPV